MGLIGKVIGGALGAKLLKRMDNAYRDPPTSGQYIPANQVDPARTQPTPMAGGVNGIVERAGRFYRENPKLVHTLGSAAVAIALARLAQRRRI
jgi:hypothetical protein